MFPPYAETARIPSILIGYRPSEIRHRSGNIVTVPTFAGPERFVKEVRVRVSGESVTHGFVPGTRSDAPPQIRSSPDRVSLQHLDKIAPSKGVGLPSDSLRSPLGNDPSSLLSSLRP